MVKRVVEIILAVVALICVSNVHAEVTKPKPAKERLVGKWAGTFKFDETKLEASLKKFKPDATADELKAEIVRAKAFVANAKITATISTDGKQTIERSGLGGAEGTVTVSGNWEIVKETADEITVKFSAEKLKDVVEIFAIQFTGDDSFSASPKNNEFEPQILFKRVK